MNATLFCLVLASLLLAPAHSADYKTFKKMHMYSRQNRAFDCTTALNAAMSGMTYCKPCNTVILGYATDITRVNDVLNVCRGQGTPLGNNLIRSNTKFRTVMCLLQSRNVAPPYCVYEGTPQFGQITLGCRNDFPVHFERC